MLVVNPRTNRCTPGGYVSTAHTPYAIDAVATCSPELRRRHLMPVEDLHGRSTVHLRIGATGDDQKTGVNRASEYQLADVIERMRSTPTAWATAPGAPATR